MDGSRPEDFGADAAPITIRVARTLDDFHKVTVVRTLVYMQEQDCPYDEEFDGNDLSGATHLIAEAGSQPIACLRIRWFNGFAKIERICVLAAYRKTKLGVDLLYEAVELIRRKGYTRLMGQIQEHLLKHWTRFANLKKREHRPRFVFSDRVYIEVEGCYDIHPEAVTMESDPLVLDRPEGEWDRPGPLDRSVARGAEPATAA
ncbi:MAG: GNAT family N-acetyltransferase [Pseudomonadota bacterium]